MISKLAISSLGAALLGTAALFPALGLADNLDGIFEVPDRPTLNFYGTAGLIDMPSGEALPDGQLVAGISNFGGQSRTWLTFQATPRIQATFRYVGIQNANFSGFETYRDRNFDVRFLLNRESRYLPAVTLGLQDFAGTGIYASEYLAATKTFSGDSIPGTVKATAGLGWGRLGSSGSIGTPFGGDRPSFRPGDTGGEPAFDQWFRGEVAPFAGVEWEVNDKLGLKAEYSSDAYTLETGLGVIERKSRFNFGAEYQATENIRLGGYYLYGTEVGVNVQVQFNPNRPAALMRAPAPQPYFIRPSRRDNPKAYDTAWANSEAEASVLVRDALIPLLEAEGLTLIETHTTASTTEVRYANNRYAETAVSVGRVARVLARLLPDSVETFRIVPVEDNLAQSAVVLRRSDLEALEFSPNSSDALLAVAGITDAAPNLPASARNEALFPAFKWSVGPYFSQRFFDPDQPIRIDAGVQLSLSYQPAAGWTIGGEIEQRLSGDVSGVRGGSNSALPPVRTSGLEYDRASATSIPTLYVSRQWKISPDVYGRVTAGHVERAFGGVSAEMLWKPAGSRLALGVEANYVKQRAFDDLLGFQDYSVATGHASAYYEFGGGYRGQLDVGRYLAGDVGGTVTLEREFSNGWRVGGFFTLTDVSAEDFGEGSFDKGITLTIPVDWLIGSPNKGKNSTTLRPLTRDGGARLSVPGRLYEQVRTGHREGLVGNWSGVWE
ncbi:YjbH domain-containing protein [Sulfitobacter guttiformis]|uniref:Exopolysaccharide biosynthesis protein YbjH n=1 Tax=Sulfitobacter guttiformis TaxID=74349 RepID=A0A420DRH8_9RHOB|nr:YjbH domain-containing protein [Sulfitobacter guttiformis]RKE96914.1 exopolysaccharide biosynthesis protein YbjH [Sulfitobacter guttiformis]